MKKTLYGFLLLSLIYACGPNKKKEENVPKEEYQEEEKSQGNPKNFEEIGEQNKQNQEKVEKKAVKDTSSKVSDSELEELKKNLKK